MSDRPELPSDVTTDEVEMMKILIPIDGVRFLDVDSNFRLFGSPGA